MDKKQFILNRLDQIAAAVAGTGEALAFLGLGSIGTELERFDEWSDLDFFVIARPGKKWRFIDNLDWLNGSGVPAYHFKNSPDGHKYLYEDGVYCEFAVFEPAEIEKIPFSAGRIIWKSDDFDPSICVPSKKNTPWRPDNLDWAMGEVLTCLYVGLCRYARGERLIAAKFVQTFALDILIAAAHFFEKEIPCFNDDFQNERRFEKRFPVMAESLPSMMLGYMRVPESALGILEFLRMKYQVNAGIGSAIEKMAEECIKSRDSSR